MKQYKINKSSLHAGPPVSILVEDNPSVRAVTLGQGKILVGTRNSEVQYFDRTADVSDEGHHSLSVIKSTQHSVVIMSVDTELKNLQ